MSADILPPHDEKAEAEAGALACVMSDTEHAAEWFAELKLADFYDSRHRTVFTALCAVRDRGGMLDVPSLYQELLTTKRVEDAGGVDYVQRLPDYTHSPAHFPSWLAIVQDFTRRRAALAESVRLNQEALSGLPMALGTGAVGTDEQTFARLAALPPHDYDRMREKEAERLGIRVGTLDGEVEKRRTTKSKSVAEATPECDPWPHPVNGQELLNEIADTYKRFCVLPAHAADVLAAWVLLTYCYREFEFAAVIAVWSPEPECGKGRVLDVTEKLSRRAFRTANTSAAVLYHSVSSGDITVLIDELDSQHPEQQFAISNILKSGFQSNGKAHRMTERNGEQVVVEFSTYCPKMLATIGLDTLDKATRTRSIGIRMQRKRREDKIAKFRRYNGADICRKCVRWVKDNRAALQAVEPTDIEECPTERQEDVWEPLVAIARGAGGEWEQRIREAARQMSGGVNAAATEAIGHQLLAAVRDYFAANGDKADTKTLIEQLNGSGDFVGINRGRGITPYFLAHNLKPYGIESRNLKIDGKVLKGYDRGDFDEAFHTYLKPPGTESAVSKRYSATRPDNIEENPPFQSATETNGSVSKNSLTPNDYADGSGVADSKAETRPAALMEADLL